MGTVLFSLLEAKHQESIEWGVVFYGVEDLYPEYRQKCEQLNIPYFALKKEQVGSFDFESQNKIYEYLLNEKPESIFCHMPNLIFVAKKYCKKNPETKLIAIEHHAFHLKRRKDWLLSAVLLHRADKVVYLSDFYREKIAERLSWFCNMKKGVVIANGINANFYKPLNIEKATSDFTVGMMGRMVEGKDFETIIEAIFLLKQMGEKVVLSIAGDGPEMGKLRDLTKAKEIEGQVDFLGLLPKEQIPQYLNGLDLYIHSTAGETINTSVMQAMAVALPVLVSDVPEVNTMVVEGENGCLFEQGNADQLVQKILLFFDNPKLIKRMGEQGRNKSINLYSSQKMLDSYLGLLRD